MADLNCTPHGSAVGANCFKEAVCIDANRIYDSCSDKDCVTNLRVYFSDCAQPIIDNATNVKAKEVKVIDVYMDVEPVPFNKGFYSIDMTYYFLVKLEAFNGSPNCSIPVEGIAYFSKKVILFGSEGNVNVFTSDKSCGNSQCCTYLKNTVPKATVQIVDPIVLSCKLKECHHKKHCAVELPLPILGNFEGNFANVESFKFVEVTLGIFFIVSLERSVQMMIPVYDFSVPDKECIQSNNDDPCELFKKIKFPVNEFFPPRLNDFDDDCD